jgi:two-component system, OmpR family, response regulator
MTIQSKPLVWVLERDPAVAASLIFALRLEGFDVEVQSDPEALGRAAGAQPDCLLLDADYPAISAVGLLSRIRARGYGGPAIFTATNPKRRFSAEVRASGARLLEKPWTGDCVISEIRSSLLKRADR